MYNSIFLQLFCHTCCKHESIYSLDSIAVLLLSVYLLSSGLQGFQMFLVSSSDNHLPIIPKIPSIIKYIIYVSSNLPTTNQVTKGFGLHQTIKRHTHTHTFTAQPQTHRHSDYTRIARAKVRPIDREVVPSRRLRFQTGELRIRTAQTLRLCGTVLQRSWNLAIKWTVKCRVQAK